MLELWEKLIIGSRAARYKRPLLSVDVFSVCVSETLMLKLSRKLNYLGFHV